MLHAVDFDFVRNNPFLSYQAYDSVIGRVPYNPVFVHRWLAAYGLYNKDLVELIVRHRVTFKSLDPPLSGSSNYEEHLKLVRAQEDVRYDTFSRRNYHEDKIKVLTDVVIVGVTSGLTEAEKVCPEKWYPPLRDILGRMNAKLNHYPSIHHGLKVKQITRVFSMDITENLRMDVIGGFTLGQMSLRNYNDLLGLLELMERGIKTAEEKRRESRG